MSTDNLKSHYCEMTGCIRKVFEPYLYCDTHQDHNSTPPVDTLKIKQLCGKVIRRDAEVLVLFKVKGKYYHADDHNSAVMDTYLHTGKAEYLDQLENEME